VRRNRRVVRWVLLGVLIALALTVMLAESQAVDHWLRLLSGQ
jgi:hypothetical protein